MVKINLYSKNLQLIYKIFIIYIKCLSLTIMLKYN